MALAHSGHVERLPSGSLRVSVLAGRDPLTGRQVWHRKTVRTEVEAQIALGRLLEDAVAGKRPDSRVTVGELLEWYLWEPGLHRTAVLRAHLVPGAAGGGGPPEAWRQIAAAIREAIRSGQIAPGEELLSAHEMAARCRVRMAATRHAPTPPTIRQIHAILSGAFAAAVRWQWIDRNPASSAKLPKADPRSPTSPEPEQVAR